MSETRNPQSAQEIPQTLYGVSTTADAAAAPSSTSSSSAATSSDTSLAKAPATAEPSLASRSRPVTCAVCLQAIATGNPVKQLCCAHVFHAWCADQWLRTELHCPICKTQVVFPVAQPAPTLRSAAPGAAHHEHEHDASSDTRARMASVPLDGTDARNYGVCRDCQQVFYRDPTTIRPETAAWYRCAHCRDSDILDMLRASCSIQ